MTLEELERGLPNGLHDARLEVLHYDVPHETISLQLLLWVGAPVDSPEQCERYRPAGLRFEEVQFLAFTPPSQWQQLTIYSAKTLPAAWPETGQAMPEGTRFYCLYFDYSELTIAARGFHFEWLGEDFIR